MKVAFAHNVHDRFLTLKDTISVEKGLFVDANVSVAYNDIFVDVFSEFNNIHTIGFNERPHKIGCINGCILSIKELLNFDFDVLIFSHDDVRINENYIDVVNSNINDIFDNKYDIICRSPEGFGNYYMMEIFYLSRMAAIQLFTSLLTLNGEYEIPRDLNNSISPEVWLYNLLTRNKLKIKKITFPLKTIENYNLNLGKSMGYYHVNAGLRGWKD